MNYNVHYLRGDRIISDLVYVRTNGLDESLVGTKAINDDWLAAQPDKDKAEKELNLLYAMNGVL